jgi:hypothetical protein
MPSTHGYKGGDGIAVRRSVVRRPDPGIDAHPNNSDIGCRRLRARFTASITKDYTMAEVMTCTSCGSRIEYVEGVDSTCCRRCDLWCEAPCDDPFCEPCAFRPLYPSDLTGPDDAAPLRGPPEGA